MILFKNESKNFALNVGTGIRTSVLELVRIFVKVNNVKVPYFIFSERRLGDICYLVSDNSNLVSELKILPKLNIEKMCRDGWKWKYLNPNGY